MKAQASVVIAARNEEARVGLAVASVLAQTFADLQLVVVDDASTDGTHCVLQTLANADPRVEILSASSRLGRAAARNWAIDRCQTDLVAILDADDLMMPRRLEKQADFMRAHPEVGMLGAGAYYLLPAGRPARRVIPPTDDGTIRRRLQGGAMPFVHPSMMFRRELLLSLGGYVQATPRYNEDYYLCVRSIRRTKAAALAEPLIVYSCDGLLERTELKAKYREMLGLEYMLLRQSFGLSRCATLLARAAVYGLTPEWLHVALMRRRLSRLPVCSGKEAQSIQTWVLELQRPSQGSRTAD